MATQPSQVVLGPVAHGGFPARRLTKSNYEGEDWTVDVSICSYRTQLLLVHCNLGPMCVLMHCDLATERSVQLKVFAANARGRVGDGLPGRAEE